MYESFLKTLEIDGLPIFPLSHAYWIIDNIIVDPLRVFPHKEDFLSAGFFTLTGVKH
jgi:hypothetical protein